MKFGVVVFPGSNCDMDMIYVLQKVMKQEVVKLWHKNTDLESQFFLFIKGFTIRIYHLTTNSFYQ